MEGTYVPLYEVMRAVSMDDGRRIMQALRLGVTITCKRHPSPDGDLYQLSGCLRPEGWDS